MSDLETFARTLAADHNLGVLVTTSPDHSEPQVSVVNVGVIAHPSTAERTVAFVARPGAKLINLRAHPTATIVARARWEWVAVRGTVELSGPDDPDLGLNAHVQGRLLRDIYHGAGGQHPDLNHYGNVMVAERRCAVLLRPQRFWSNPPGSEHVEPADTRATSS
jgi:PPOX class probable F420-dependent enzyme